MRIRFRYSLTTLLLLPLLVGIGIKWYRGPHEYSLIEMRTPATLAAQAPDPFTRCILLRPRTVSFWAYGNFDGSLTRHGPETSIGPRGDKVITEFRGGRRNGSYRYWSAEGELICEGQFENDEPVGEWVYYRFGVAYQRVEYDHDQQQVVESRYELDRLAERRVNALGTDEVSLTAWHPNGEKRLEGRLLKERPIGKWRWWDINGRETRTVTFHHGVPAEFVGRPSIERFLDAALDLDFHDVPLQVALDYLGQFGVKTRIECAEEDAREVRNRAITTSGDFKGALAFYLALRDAGLTLDVCREKDGGETMVILRADEG